jgi:hypothetical protein
MGISAVNEQIPTLALHRYPSAALWRALVSDIRHLDAASQAGRPVFCGGFGHPQELAVVNPFRKWWGGFRYLSGMTTLTVVTRSASVAGGDVMRVYLDGTLATSWTLSNGEQTHTYTLTGLTNGAAVEVVLQVYSASRDEGEDISPAWGTYNVWDAYVGPVEPDDAWPGLPTLSDTYSEAHVEQITEAAQWLAQAIGRRTDPLFQALLRWPGPYGPTDDEVDGYQYALWYGDLVFQDVAPELVARGQVWVDVVADEEIALLVDGVSVGTYTVPGTAGGPYDWEIVATLAETHGTRVEVEVQYTRSSNPALVNGAEPVNHWSLRRVETRGTGSSQVNIATPQARTSVTWTTWKGALQDAIDALQAIYDRITDNDDIWSRQRLFRRRYAMESHYDSDPKKREAQNRWFEPAMVALQRAREGEAVLVRGERLAIGWANQTWDETGKNELDLYPMQPLRTAGVGSTGEGDPLTELIYLRDLEGLPVGAFYTVRGEDVRYAGEVWRVGEDVA